MFRLKRFAFLLSLRECALKCNFFRDSTLFMEQQQQGFNDSSDRVQNSAKSLLSALQLMSICQNSIQGMGQVISTRFKSQENSSNRRTSKESFWPIRARPENFEIICLLMSKEWNDFAEFFLSILQLIIIKAIFYLINNHFLWKFAVEPKLFYLNILWLITHNLHWNTFYTVSVIFI